jgi:hypothetical protein
MVAPEWDCTLAGRRFLTGVMNRERMPKRFAGFASIGEARHQGFAHMNARRQRYGTDAGYHNYRAQPPTASILVS